MDVNKIINAPLPDPRTSSNAIHDRRAAQTRATKFQRQKTLRTQAHARNNWFGAADSDRATMAFLRLTQSPCSRSWQILTPCRLKDKLTGWYLFVLPYATKWRGGRGTD
jgi:hypothetical protein